MLFLPLKGDSDMCTFTLRFKNVKERQLLLGREITKGGAIEISQYWINEEFELIQKAPLKVYKINWGLPDI